MAPRKISELFYELRAKTEGLEKDLSESERQLGKFSQFVKANPTAVLGAFATAIAGVGIQATRMAEDVDRAARRMAVNLPEGARGLTTIKEAVVSVSRETGRLQEETLSLFEVISKQGVASAQEIETRALAIEKFADATNASRESTAAGLDQLMDAFGIVAGGAELALAKVASVAEGRSGVEDVLDALQAAAPVVAKYSLDFETTIKALVALMDTQGLTAGQAGKILKSLDGEGIREYAKQAEIAADALVKLNERADLAREGLDRLSNRTKNEFTTAMVNLGEKVLPFVTSAANTFVMALNAVTGAYGRVEARANAANLGYLGKKASTKGLSNTERAELRDLINDLPGNFADGTFDPKTLPLNELKAFYSGLVGGLKEVGKESDSFFYRLKTETAALIAQKSRLEASTAASSGGKKPPRILTSDEKADLAKAAQKIEDDAFEAARKSLEQASRGMAGTLQSLTEDLQGEFQSTIAALTGDAIRAMELADAATRARFASNLSITDEQRAQLADFQEQLRLARGAALAVDDALERMKRGATEGTLKPMQEMRELSKQELLLLDTKAALDEKDLKNAEALKTIAAALQKIEERRAELAGKTAEEIQRQRDEAAKLQSTTHRVASAIEGAANAAYGLVQILDEGDSTLGKLVVSAGQLAGGIAKASSSGFGALSVLEKLGTIGSITGGALAVGQVLFGEDPAEKERLRLLSVNNERLRELTETVGLLGSVALSGSAASSASAIASRLAGRGVLNSENELAATAALAGSRLTRAQYDELVAAGKALGIEVTGNIATLQQAIRAILEASGKLGEFGDDFEGFSRQAEASRKILGTDNPAQRMADLAAASSKASPAIAKLFEGIDLADPADLEQLQQRVRDFFRIMEAGGAKLSAADLGSLTGDQLVGFLQEIITGIGELTPVAQTAAEQLAAARSDLATEFEILDTDVGGQLARLAAVYGAQGGVLADLVKDLDPSSAEGAALLTQRIEALFRTLQDPENTVDLAGLSLKELLAALLDLKHGADAVAGGIQTAAEKMQDAANALQTDFEVFGTDQVGQAEGLAGLYGGVGGIGGALGGLNLKSASGRAAAIAALQQLYSSDKGNTEQTTAIRELLRSLRAVPEEKVAGEATTSGGGDTGSPERQTSGSERITIQQADRLLSLTETLVVFARQTAEHTRVLDAFLRPAVFSPLAAPQLPSLGAGATQVTIRITQVIHLNGAVVAGGAAAATTFGQQIGLSAANEIDKRIGTSVRTARLTSGNPVARG